MRKCGGCWEMMLSVVVGESGKSCELMHIRLMNW